MLRLPHTGVTPDMLGEIMPLLGIVGLDKARVELDATIVPEEVARYVVGVVRKTRVHRRGHARRELARRDPPHERDEGERAARGSGHGDDRGRPRRWRATCCRTG